MNLDDARLAADAQRLERERAARALEHSARYAVQQHARLADAEQRLTQLHAEMDDAQANRRALAQARVVHLAAAARRAARHYRRLLDGAVGELRVALGLPAIPTDADLTADPEAVPDVPALPAVPDVPPTGIADTTPTGGHST